MSMLRQKRHCQRLVKVKVMLYTKLLKCVYLDNCFTSKYLWNQSLNQFCLLDGSHIWLELIQVTVDWFSIIILALISCGSFCIVFPSLSTSTSSTIHSRSLHHLPAMPSTRWTASCRAYPITSTPSSSPCTRWGSAWHYTKHSSYIWRVTVPQIRTKQAPLHYSRC